jgi:arylformamidase
VPEISSAEPRRVGHCPSGSSRLRLGSALDTPFHRFADGHDLTGLDLARVADVPGVVVTVPEPEAGPELLDGIDLAGRAVLFRTGWDVHWGRERYGEAGHPYLAIATAERLAEAGAAIVGIDSVNIDDTRGGERPIHTTLLAAGIPIVEHLTGLDALGTPFRFFAVPPAIAGLGTFIVRAFALT